VRWYFSFLEKKLTDVSGMMPRAAETATQRN